MLEISSSLLGTENSQTHQILKNIIAETFDSILDYNQWMHQYLAERILTEIDVDRNKFNIYTAICHKNKFDPINDFLFPLVPDDILIANYDITAITEKINQDGESFLFTIFMECNSLVISEILSKESIYKSVITTDQNTYTANARLRPSAKYLQAIETLYEVFQYNGIAWKTVNNPYLQKFLDVVLVDAPSIDSTETIKEITVNLGAYEQYKKIDMLPLWNINRFSTRNTSFPIPANDVIHYEYTLLLHELGLAHGYLASPDLNELKYVKHYPDKLTLISSNDAVKQWSLLKICQTRPKEIPWINYQLVSNSFNEKFINQSVPRRQPSIIRKQSEIYKLVSSFEDSQDFSLQQIQVLDKCENITGTYNFNSFMPDNIRDEHSKRILLLTFSTNRVINFYTIDRLSFFVSEVQVRFPEYHCIGEIKSE